MRRIVEKFDSEKVAKIWVKIPELMRLFIRWNDLFSRVPIGAPSAAAAADFDAAANLDPTTFQLLSQMKTIFTGLLFRVFLKRRLSAVQYLALLTLACGTACSQLPSGAGGQLRAGGAAREREQSEVLHGGEAPLEEDSEEESREDGLHLGEELEGGRVEVGCSVEVCRSRSARRAYRDTTE